MNFYDVLDKIRLETSTTVALGDRFERLTQQFFLTTPLYQDLIENNLVWLWKDFPYKDTNDLGIDLVVKTKEDGYWAIQCKCYQPNNNVNTSDLGKFVAKTQAGFVIDGKKMTYSRMCLITTSSLTNNASDTWHKQDIPKDIIYSGILDDSELIGKSYTITSTVKMLS